MVLGGEHFYKNIRAAYGKLTYFLCSLRGIPSPYAHPRAGGYERGAKEGSWNIDIYKDIDRVFEELTHLVGHK